MDSYIERLLGLARLAAIYAYCVEIGSLNDYRLNRERVYEWDDETAGHNYVRALYLMGLVDKTLWHEWNDGSYKFYKNQGVPDPNYFDLALAASKLHEVFEYPMQHAAQYGQGIIR